MSSQSGSSSHSNSNCSSPRSPKVWAQAIHAVAERRLTLRQASQTYEVQPAALHRLVRQHTLQQQQQQRRQPPSSPSRSPSPTHSSNNPHHHHNNNDSYVFPRLNPLALGHSSPVGVSLPAVTVSPSVYELTPEINDEIVAILREQFVPQQQQQQQHHQQNLHGSSSNNNADDRCYSPREGYADSDITDVVRAIVGRNGRRALPSTFPSSQWLNMFKRENDFSNCQQQQQDEPQRHGQQLRWVQNRSHRQVAAPPPPLSPPVTSPTPQHTAYVWDNVDGAGRCSDDHQCLPFQPLSHQLRDSSSKFRHSPSVEDAPGLDRNYRQSNLVPAKVWEAAMEDVAIHGMSLRNAAKAHGVHFAALHRRLKKRQQHKLSMPCEPNYIPFEDEAGVVRVIHARAEMGVLLTFTELVDLLQRTALKHRPDLPEEVATALVRRFQSRVEQSIRHLILDWPALPSNVLYRLRTAGGSESDQCRFITDGSAAASSGSERSLPSLISGGSRGGTPLSSSGSSSSLSSHPGAAYPVMHKSPVSSTSKLTWSNLDTGNKCINDSVNGSVAAVSPPSDDSDNVPVTAGSLSETASRQPCMLYLL
uniref:HTH psq-type domain-containing protein n=1 Tax=Peronospora matthiolae TaxID=2874970 RepID=A0AAV1UKU2_9STRA